MNELILAAHAFFTLAMTGLIWFVQIVHYPLFAAVGREAFPAYEKQNQLRTSLVIVPLMVGEGTTAILLFWFRQSEIPVAAVWLGLGLATSIWVSTFTVQIPTHFKLLAAFDAALHRRLVRSNWFRTVVWTARGCLVLWMVGR